MARNGTDSLKEARLTESVLAALEKSTKNAMTLRLIKGIRQAWRERDEAVGGLDLERAELVADEAKRKEDNQRSAEAFEGREKVLVIIRVDGFVECYAEPWVDVRIIAERLSDETDEDLERRMPHYYRSLFYPGYVREVGLALLKPEIDGPAIARLMAFEARVDAWRKMEEVLEALKAKQ